MPDLQRLQIGWYTHGLTRELVLIYPVYAILMGEVGVSPFELSVLFAVWSGSVILFEVPSGTLGDRFSRKQLIAVSGLIKGTCFWTWLAFPTFWGFLIGFLLWGLGSSLRSGTAESFLHDTLEHLGAGDQFAKVYGRGTAFEQVGVGLAFAIGGAVAESGFGLPLVLSALGPWLASAIALGAWTEPPRSAEPADADEDTYLGTMASGFREARNSRSILAIVGLTATAITAGGVLDEYVGPFLNDKSLSLTIIGLIYAGTSLTSILGVSLAHRLPFRTIGQVARFLVVGSLVLLAGAALPGLAAGAMIILFGVFIWSSDVLIQTQLQARITGPARATITSLAGMGQEIIGVVLYLVVGATVQTWGWSTGVAVIAVFGGISAALFANEREVR